MSGTHCAICTRAAATSLPVRLSIDCATSTYTGVQARIAFCQDCLDRLGELTDRRLNQRALRAAAAACLVAIDPPYPLVSTREF